MKDALKIAVLAVVANSLVFSIGVAETSKKDKGSAITVVDEIESARERIVNPTVPCPDIAECPNPFGEDKNEKSLFIGQPSTAQSGRVQIHF